MNNTIHIVQNNTSIANLQGLCQDSRFLETEKSTIEGLVSSKRKSSTSSPSHTENDGTLGMLPLVPSIVNPIYTLSIGYITLSRAPWEVKQLGADKMAVLKDPYEELIDHWFPLVRPY